MYVHIKLDHFSYRLLLDEEGAALVARDLRGPQYTDRRVKCLVILQPRIILASFSSINDAELFAGNSPTINRAPVREARTSRHHGAP